MRVLHLTASPFFGGPERVILDIATTQRSEPWRIESTIVSFSENGGCEPFLAKVAEAGLEGIRLRYDMPRLVAATFELIGILKDRKIDLLLAHGHKSRMVGYFATRRVGIPIVGVSHGWTWQDFRTQIYEGIDRWMHRRMDRVVCVSRGQAEKVRRCGVAEDRICVIPNGIDPSRFAKEPNPEVRQKLLDLFDSPPKTLVGAAGRLSPEKGYDILIDALARTRENLAVVLFGDGFLRAELQEQIDRLGLTSKIRLAGFTSELDRFFPAFDLFVQSSRTEGFPCVNLEAMASGIPVVATAVGGVPEQIESERTGILVPPEDPEALASALDRLAADPEFRRMMGTAARTKVEKDFSCAAQAEAYADLYRQMLSRSTG